MTKNLSYDVTRTVTDRQLAYLRPYLIGEEPRPNGEWDMHCPLHEDTKRSASLNIRSGKWKCFGSCGAGSVAALVKKRKGWVDPPDAGYSSSGSGGKSQRAKVLPTEANITGWIENLHESKKLLSKFKKRRGLKNKTIKRFEIGYDLVEEAYTIPIRNHEGGFWNIRKYQLDPDDDRRKIWSIDGMGSPRLYPVSVLDNNPESIVFCEGELDALILIQNGFDAVTRTGGATTWNPSWNKFFSGKTVYIIQDRDSDGLKGSNMIIAHLNKIANELRLVELPYPLVDKHGKDVTDFFLDGNTSEDLQQLMRESKVVGGAAPTRDAETITGANVLDTFDSRRVGEPLRFEATVQGKLQPGHSSMQEVQLRCTMDRSEACQNCPLMAADGVIDVEITEREPQVLETIDTNKAKLVDVAREKLNIKPCNRIQMEVLKHRSVETLYVRESVDAQRGHDGPTNFVTRKVVSVGRHDTEPNTTVMITGALYPNPKTQKNEFLAWDVEAVETSLDKFELQSGDVGRLLKFQPREGQRPLAKRVEIARQMSEHVTKIYGRDEMHVMFDLLFHSVLNFDFDDQYVHKGWLDILIIGDTRTGKSEVAGCLSKHYQVGEMVNCEAASFAGIVGGLQQHGGGGEFSINWGIVPINDRRLVILDEAGGMTKDEIAQLSGVRSSGVVKITKIQQGETSARTRLGWLANPRDARLDAFTYGVDALRPLIGNYEDIARFDMVMSVKFDPKLALEINKQRVLGEFRYPSDDCHLLLMWAWSRKREQVKFTDRAVRATYKAAINLGRRYTEEPPLIQIANVRHKIARGAAALAASTFSTDETHENVVVTDKHVRDFVSFLDRVYGMREFGYLERSTEAIEDARYARKCFNKTEKYLMSKPGLAKYLRSSGRFKRQDLEEIMNCTRDGATTIINQLSEFRMIRKEGGFVIVTPALHDLLRERDVE